MKNRSVERIATKTITTSFKTNTKAITAAAIAITTTIQNIAAAILPFTMKKKERKILFFLHIDQCCQICHSKVTCAKVALKTEI